MSIVAEILSSFEKQLISIISSKEEIAKSMLEMDEDFFARYGSKEPKQVRLHELFQQQPKTLITSIDLEISSDELADEVHKEICELIKKKEYSLEEIE